jgi:dynein heavy chain
VLRLVRILRQPRGNALLLVGLGGEGHSIAKLAAYVAEYEFFELAVTRTYKVDDWKNDLKRGNQY